MLTGDMWGGGTDANVYLTIYGDRGDTGVRQLYADTKGVYFKQGQVIYVQTQAYNILLCRLYSAGPFHCFSHAIK